MSLFLPNLGGGGAERVMTNIANALVERHPLEVVLCDASGPNLGTLSSKIAIVDLRSPSTKRAIVPLARYLRQRRPRTLLSALGHANVAAIAANVIAGSPARVVAAIHNNMSSAAKNDPSLKGRLLPRAEALAYRFAHAVVAVSVGVADDFAKLTGFPRRRIRVVYNPVVNPELYEKARVEPRHPWFPPTASQPVFVTIGRLVAQKDQATLLHALALLRRQIPARLMILGDGPERATLERLSSKLELSDAVEFSGFVANPFPFVSAATAFVLSSAWEGLPTVLIEALALGTPIVSTDCPSGPREILQDGRLGLLVPVGDPESLANALLRTVEQPLLPDPSAAESYTIDTAVDAYRSILFPSRIAATK